MQNSDMKFEPSFDNTCESFNKLVDKIAGSISQLPRVEHQLFQTVENLPVTYIPCIELDDSIVKEDILVDVKERIRKVIMANSHGPKK